MRNFPEWAIAFWATQALGAVVVPLNAWWTGPELAYGLDRLRRASCCSPTTSGPSASRRTSARRRCGPPSRSVPTRRRRRGRVDDVVDGDDPPLPDGRHRPRRRRHDHVHVGHDRAARRARSQTHRNFGDFLMQGVYLTTAAAASAPPPDPAGRAPPPPATLLTFPLFHVGGLQSFLLPYTVGRRQGRAHVQVGRRARPSTSSSASGSPPSPACRRRCSSCSTRRRQKGSDARRRSPASRSGATLVPPELVRRIDEQFASRAAPGNGYGLTETSGAAIANFGADYVANPESVGKPISPVIEVRIADPDGDDACRPARSARSG